MAVCPACEDSRTTPFTRHDGMALLRCGGCGLIFLDPLPDADLVAELYDDAYEGASASYFTKIDKKMRRSRRRIAWLARYAPTGRFLDIGCNGGFMVEAAREHGYEAHGLDVDPVSIRYAKQHYPQNAYHLGPIEGYAAEGQGFDLIYCSEVIEHVPAVRRFVANIVRLLRVGGHVFITTPDIGHWRRPRDLTTWDAFCPPSHCLYFSPSSLRRLLEAAGLTVVKARFAWKPGIKMLCRRDD